MANPHSISPEIRDSLVAAAAEFNRYWSGEINLHGNAWEVQEVRCVQADGKGFGETAEAVYGEEAGADEDFVEIWEGVQGVLGQIPEEIWDSFDHPEPWLAVKGLPDAPVVVWRVFDSSPVSYDHFRELPTE